MYLVSAFVLFSLGRRRIKDAFLTQVEKSAPMLLSELCNSTVEPTGYLELKFHAEFENRIESEHKSTV